MKKLGRKGYLTVEVILASAVAVLIAVFLINLTVRLVNKTDDAYIDTLLATDKVLITNKIMDDINKRGLLNTICKQNDKGDNIGIEFNFSDGTYKELAIQTIVNGPNKGKQELTYGDLHGYDELYTKIFETNFNEIKYSCEKIANYISIKLTLKNIYSDYDYGFNLIVQETEQQYVVTLKFKNVFNGENKVRFIKDYKFKGSELDDGYYYINNIIAMEVDEETLGDFYIIDHQSDCSLGNASTRSQGGNLEIAGSGSDTCIVDVCPRGQEAADECKPRV